MEKKEEKENIKIGLTKQETKKRKRKKKEEEKKKKEKKFIKLGKAHKIKKSS